MSPNQNKKSDLTRLLDDTPESFYWAGLLAADGCFEERGRLHLSLNDHEHVRRFARFINWRGKESRQHNTIGIHVMDVVLVRAFCEKFDLQPRKTYSPPLDIPSNDSNLRFSFAVGFTDGDGCLLKHSGGRRGAFLRIKCHRSWCEMLGKIIKALCGRDILPAFPGGYVMYSISEHAMLKEIKRRAVALRLPVLERKWDNIDLDWTSRHEKASFHVAIATKMLGDGFRKIDVARHLKVTAGAVTLMIDRHDIPAYRGKLKRDERRCYDYLVHC